MHYSQRKSTKENQNNIQELSSKRKDNNNNSHYLILGLQTENDKLKKQLLDMKSQLYQMYKQNSQLRKQLMNINTSKYPSQLMAHNNNSFSLHNTNSNFISAKFPQNPINYDNLSPNFQFIQQCTQQIQRLKLLIIKLQQQKKKTQLCQTATQRQQIKDRIIMKLEDQLITVKLQLKEQRLKSTHMSLAKQNNFGNQYNIMNNNNIEKNYRNQRSFTDKFNY